MNIALLYNKEKKFNNLPNIIYKIFHRDIKNFLDLGFNFGVYFYDVNKEIKIEEDEDIIICLIDDRFVINKEKFIRIYNKYPDKKYIFISYTKNFKNIKEIEYKNYIDGENENNIIAAILYELARYLFGVNKLKLFLSYKRNDEKYIPIKNIREYIHNNTKLNDFFDVFSIEYGEDFLEKIEQEIQNAVLVSFWSDNYSQSQWCKDEVLFAKKYNIPVIVIDCIKKKDINAFPYMFNNLVLNCNLSNEEIINEILLEVIRFFNNKNELEKFKTMYQLDNFSILPRKIEALDLTEKEKILYPDPPIGKLEKELLKGKFLTPTEYFVKFNLDKKIAISVSETDNFDNGIGIEHLQDTVIELVRFLMLSGNKIIYGGDIKYSLGINFAEIIFDLALKYSNKKPAIINPLPTKIFNKLDDNIQAKYIDIIKFEDVGDDLSKMREHMAEIENARIIIGGKLKGYQGKYPGILEEAYYTLKAQKPLYIIGAFGGVAKEFVRLRNGEDVEEWKDFAIYNKIKNLPLNNNLSENENKILFYSKDINKIIKTLIKGISNV